MIFCRATVSPRTGSWQVVLMVAAEKQTYTISDPATLRGVWAKYKSEIYIGYGIKQYDQYIIRGILAGADVQQLHEFISGGEPGWKYKCDFGKFPMTIYDLQGSDKRDLHAMQGHMGLQIGGGCECECEAIMKIFLCKKEEFAAHAQIITTFELPKEAFSFSESRLVSTVLGCKKQSWENEKEFKILPCVQLNKYRKVQDWFLSGKCFSGSYKFKAAKIPHKAGLGGLHGAPDTPISAIGGLMLHIDASGYYHSIITHWGLVTRAATQPEKYEEIYKKRLELKYSGKKTEQLPYKKLLAALTGAMKDKTSAAYDPGYNLTMCINGQLMILMLIEKLEQIPGLELVQTNTDGLIVRIPDENWAFEALDSICWHWEQQCKVRLEFQQLRRIFQKDINTYAWEDIDRNVKRKGDIKESGPLDYDMPIVAQAVADYLLHKIPVEETMRKCDDMRQYQHIVRLSGSMSCLVASNKSYYTSCRVFASSYPTDTRLLGKRNGKFEKVPDTPEKCRVYNDAVTWQKCPDWLDKDYYINLANKRLHSFGAI